MDVSGRDWNAVLSVLGRSSSALNIELVLDARDTVEVIERNVESPTLISVQPTRPVGDYPYGLSLADTFSTSVKQGKTPMGALRSARTTCIGLPLAWSWGRAGSHPLGTSENPTLTPNGFIAKWHAWELKDRPAAQARDRAARILRHWISPVSPPQAQITNTEMRCREAVG